jgi:hypothetical protein
MFRSASAIRRTFEAAFPDLRNARWLIKSPWNDTYKCIPWAACRTDVLWWPVDDPQVYWPPGVPFDDKIEFFVQAFSTLGYSECDNPEFEFGYQKVAIYATNDRRVRHMARQHLLGRGWLSKCGQLEDILHPTLECIEGDPTPLAAMGGSYGEVAQILRRSWWAATINLCFFRCFWAAIRFWLYRLAHPSWIRSNIRGK